MRGRETLVFRGKTGVDVAPIPFLAAVLAAAVLVAVVPGAALAAGTPNTQVRGDQRMNAVNLSISIARTQVLTGESFPVQVRLHNHGADRVEAPDPGRSAPFDYVLFASDGASRFVFNKRRYRAARNPNDRSNEPGQVVTLAPGEKIDYTEDFSGLASEPVPPGRYLMHASLTVGGEEHRSEPVPIEFVAPDPGALAVYASDAREQIAYGFSIGGAAGGPSIWQGLSEMGNPVLGALHRRSQAAEGAKIGSIAVSIEAPTLAGGSWIAWVADGKLSALMGNDRSAARGAAPVDLGLADAMLLSPGRNLADGRGQFVVVGRRGTDHVLKEIVVSGVRAALPPPPGAPTPPTRRADSAPSADVREHVLGPALPASLHLRHFGDEGPGRFELVGTHVHGVTTRIIARRIGEGASFRLVFSLDEPIAAFAVPPLQAKGEGYASALFGPTGPERRMSYVRVNLDTGAVVASRSINEKDVLQASGGGSRVDRWLLSEGLAKSPPIMAVVGNRLLVLRPESAGSGWSLLHEFRSPPQRIELISLLRNDRYGRSAFALAMTPADGILVVPSR